MPKNRKAAPQSSTQVNKEPSRCLSIANRGIKNSNEMSNLMSALVTDLIAGTITPNIGNAVCNASGKLLKLVELQQKYGTQGVDGRRTLTLTFEVSNAAKELSSSEEIKRLRQA